MDPQSFQQVGRHSPEAIPVEMRRIEGREWWLWGFAVAVTLALTLGIISFTFPWFERETNVSYWFDLREWVRGLAALVLLFDFYAIYQHLQLHRIRRQLAERDQLFQLISENAADMIAPICCVAWAVPMRRTPRRNLRGTRSRAASIRSRSNNIT